MDEQVTNFYDDIDILVEDEYKQDNSTKYGEIKKLIEYFDTWCPYWSEEDKIIKIKFLHFVDDQAFVNKSIPKRVKSYTWLSQKMQHNYKIKIILFQVKNKKPIHHTHMDEWRHQ